MSLTLPVSGKVTLYTTTYCPYCVRAKEFLKRHAIDFNEIDVTHTPELREQLVSMTQGRTTVPQIFIGTTSIGGFDDMNALQKTGEFSSLLASEGISYRA